VEGLLLERDSVNLKKKIWSFCHQATGVSVYVWHRRVMPEASEKVSDRVLYLVSLRWEFVYCVQGWTVPVTLAQVWKLSGPNTLRDRVFPEILQSSPIFPM